MTKEILNIHQSYTFEKNSLTIGFFDGLHKGHQALFEEVLASPYKKSILSFSSSMKSLLKNQKEDLLLLPAEKEERIRTMGFDNYWILEFTPDVRDTSIEGFLDFLKGLNCKEIVVGDDFTFAKYGKGKAKMLSILEEEGISVKIVPLLTQDSVKISSSLIKEELRKNHIEKANSYLGYRFFYQGEVVHGLENGRKIGFPTANIRLNPLKIELNQGVYKTKTILEGKEYKSMTNIGSHPTISELNRDIIETNILDYEGDLYGKTLKVEFLSYLRPQVKFKNLSELKRQLEIDVLEANQD